MSREEVTSFSRFGPFDPVQVTGGLETQNALVNGEKTTVSFVFSDDQLDYIQVRKYEGSDYGAARDAALELFDEFGRMFGGASIPGVTVEGQNGLDRDAFSVVVDRVLGTAKELSAQWEKDGRVGTFMFDLVPNANSGDTRLQGRFGYSGRFKTYYVFLFEDRAEAPERRVNSNVTVEDL